MARTKGATAADRAAHVVFDTISLFGGGRNHGNYCFSCGTALLTAYHEERLYSVHCPTCGTVTLIKAGNPSEAEKDVIRQACGLREV